MSWLFGQIYLFWRWLVETADESGQSSGLTSGAQLSSNANTLQDGNSQQQPDIDTRPVGRCYNEAKRLKDLINQARAVDAAMREALTAFWACRDAAEETRAEAALQGLRQLHQAQIFDTRKKLLDRIEGYTETPE